VCPPLPDRFYSL